MGYELDFEFWLSILFFIVFPLFMLGVLILLALLVCALWKGLQNQSGIVAALETMNKTNAVVLDTLKGIRTVSPVAVAEAGDDSASEQDEAEEAETPADFVYCPECSTRVEVDPFIRNINVVCPDCKKPFHIH